MPPGSPTRRQGNSRSTGGNRPLYAIDFTAVACGKRIANTKRRVRWRFGFANPDALAAGETGTACRGEEHDVTLVWSVTSGKRLILCDGQEVHYSNSRSAVIDFSWTMRGNHVLKVVAHATAPMSADPGFRQYDFFVDGRSFFSFPKVYRLGLTGNKTMSPDNNAPSGGNRNSSRSGMAESSGRRKSTTIAQIEAPHNPDEEEAYLREAIKASLEDEKRNGGPGNADAPKISSEAADLLIDFMDDFDAGGATPAAAPAGNEWALAPVPVQPNNQWAQAPPPPAQQQYTMSPQPPAAPIQQQQPTYDQYGGGSPAFAQAPPSNPFAPAPVQAQPPVQQNYAPAAAFVGAPPPAFAQQPQQPTPAYGGMPPAAPVASDPFNPQPPAPPAEFPGTPQQPIANGHAPAAAPVQLTMGSLTSDGLLSGSAANAVQNDASATMADKALQNLMGSIDSFGITGGAAKPPAATANPFESSNIVNNATLGEIKHSKNNEKKSVMNAPPQPGPGAMVMSGNQGGNWGGGGYGMQQQAPPQYNMSGGYPQQQPHMGMQQQPMMGQQQPMMGGQQPPPQMGMQSPMQPQQGGQYGQQPPQQQQNQWGGY